MEQPTKIFLVNRGLAFSGEDLVSANDFQKANKRKESLVFRNLSPFQFVQLKEGVFALDQDLDIAAQLEQAEDGTWSVFVDQAMSTALLNRLFN
jgi:hypothetical protein